MSRQTTRQGQRQGQKKAVALAWIQHSLVEYERTQNPVFAWDAIATCLSARLEFPPVIRDYLFGAAREITRLSRDGIPGEGRVSQAVTGALGFASKGRNNPFRVHAQQSHELMVAFDVYSLHTRNWWNQRKGLGATHDWNTIYRDVAESHRCLGCQRSTRGISAATVKRFWYKHALSMIPAHLIKQSSSQKLDDILR